MNIGWSEKAAWVDLVLGVCYGMRWIGYLTCFKVDDIRLKGMVFLWAGLVVCT